MSRVSHHQRLNGNKEQQINNLFDNTLGYNIAEDFLFIKQGKNLEGEKLMNNYLLGISYDNWKKTCDIFLNPKIKSSLSMYLQDYPLTRISEKNIEYIKSKDFFEEFISTGKIFLNPTVMKRSSNYITKNSGGFRDSRLLSPFLFLLLQSIGVEIYSRYIPLRDENPKLITYYSGDFSQNIAIYRSQYREFCEVNTHLAKEFPFFIKTDVSDYFSNIKLDRLIKLVNSRIDKKEFTSLQLKMIKNLLYYCGNSKFPLIENSISTSFLATVIYLDQIDVNMGNFISNIPDIEDYRLVRYVDDLYIWIKPKNYNENKIKEINSVYNNIIFKYSSILHECGLTLNTNKTSFNESKEISKQLKTNIYDELIPIREDPIDLDKDDVLEKIKEFIDKLMTDNENHDLTKEDLDKIIDHIFKPQEAIEYTGVEVLRNIVFDKSEYLQDESIIRCLNEIIEKQGISFIYLSPQILTTMILSTQSSNIKDSAVKTLLSKIFDRSRQNLLNGYDIKIAIYYLLKTHFNHSDLKKKVIKKYDPALFEYIKSYCNNDFVDYFWSAYIEQRNYTDVIDSDWKTYYLYVNYLFELDDNNFFDAFAYYKTYFDRITALIYAYKTKTKLDVNKFYKVNDINNVYKDLPKIDSHKIIKKAGDLRNGNPLVHASSKLLETLYFEKDIDECIKKLQELIDLRIKSFTSKIDEKI